MRAHKKIAWVSPFGPLSDIGAHSSAIVRALHRRAPQYDCEVVLFVNPNGSTYRSEARQLIMDKQFPPETLSLFDVAVLNIGNNLENHDIVNQIALTRGGVVVVHDIVMQHYLAWKIFESLELPGRYADIMCKYYGPPAIDVLARSGVTLKDQATRYTPWESDHAFTFPLIEPFLEKAQAVVVHSRFASEIVREITDCPRLELFLPSDKKRAPTEIKPAADRRIRFSVVGHVSRSKHIHLCIEALLLSDFLRGGATLSIAGGANDNEYVRELHEIVRENNLQDVVKFEFDITETRLFEIKSTTDVFVNVRFPNIESASGSLAEQMACGVPVIVFDSGCYREIPDAAVCKIRDLATSDDLRLAMETLARNPDARAAIGKAALNFGRTRRSDDYAVKFLQFIRENEFGTDPGGPASSPFSWLRPGPDGPGRSQRSGPDIFEPRDRPDFQTLGRLAPPDLALYLSVAIFRFRVRTERLAIVADVLSRTHRQRLAMLVARLAFYNRIFVSSEPARLSELEFDADADAFGILCLLRPQLFVSVLYLCMLERAPLEGEVDAQLVKLSEAGPSGLIRAFAQSQEFARRAPPQDVVESINALAQKIDAYLVRDPSRWPLLRRGVEVDRNALSEVMAEGWHEMEPDGAWSRSLSATLRFRLEPAEASSSAIRLDLRALLVPSGGRQGVALNLNGEDIGYVPVTSGDLFQVEIPFDAPGPSNATLTLSVDRLVRLSDFEPHGDNRSLGVFLYGMRIGAAPAPVRRQP